MLQGLADETCISLDKVGMNHQASTASLLVAPPFILFIWDETVVDPPKIALSLRYCPSLAAKRIGVDREQN